MIGYLDLPSGLSGDMLLGCLLDAGWTLARLRAAVEALNLPDEWSIEARSVMKGPLRATKADVSAAESLHGRHLEDVRSLIAAARLPDVVKDRAIAIFTRLAEAEAKVHGTTLDRVHFHEVGALDAIIDIVGTVCGLADLDVQALHASAPPLGDGWVDTMHGRVPLPAPATLELLAAVGAPSRPAPGPGEWLTPTGAAVLAELAVFGQPSMRLARIGTGAGQRDCDWPNVARLWLGDDPESGPLVQMDTNIDDMNPQLFAAVSDRLMAAGALDVWLTPVQMKKGRPAVVLSALGAAAAQSALCDLMLRETTTLGVRVHAVRRHEARREQRRVQTPHGQVGLKLKWVDNELVGATPEYDDCAALAQGSRASTREIYEAALAAARGMIDRENSEEAGVRQ